MKITAFLAVIVALAFAGCQSERPSGSNISRAPEPAQVSYTVELIPNPRLSATSREGDQPNEVYSSNIVAVHVHQAGVSRVTVTNAVSGESAKK